ncbi:ATP-dependent RNA helicase DEAH12, chloroplastic [Mycena venus]|uniref:RBR-type E3 ubiquitin transferase n=1 Tax=Mycena venus TaxID=2733690 RepID=A0A8H7CZI0_9AGAR|nr:ATP-dependent RNA helicase DEAH12, chloroplastic [Mycena venus]
MPSAAKSRACKYFQQGRCTHGDNCRFTHQIEDGALPLPPRVNTTHKQRKRDPGPDIPGPSTIPNERASISVSTTAQSEPPSLLSPQTRSRAKRSELPCHAWRDGHCPKGAKCWYAHDPQVQEAERLRREHVARVAEQRALEMERQRTAWLARLPEQEATERARQNELEARKAEIRRKEAAQTLQHIVLGTTLVTYSAGISIQQIVTGFDACRIQIRNLPLDATHDEIKALFTQQGVDQARLFITGIKELPDKHLEATLITGSEEGGAIAAGLEDIEFRQERLHFEVTENTRSDGMGSATSKDSDTLTLSWRAPSNSVVVTFSSINEATAKVKELNRQICDGRRVRVEMNQPPPGCVRGADWQRAVKISGLPAFISPQTVTQFTGSYLIKFLKPISYDVGSGLRLLRLNMERVAGGELKSFDVVAQDDVEGNITVKARFDSWETAKRVQDSLAGRQVYLGGCFLRLWLPNPLQYIISIPHRQYQAQKRMWDSLTGSEPGGSTSNKTAYVRIFPTQNGKVQIKVLGEDKKAVGSLKVRVENLVGGEQLSVGCWHRSFKTPAGTQFLNSIFDRTGAYARADWKLGVVKVYGDTASVDQARDVVKAEVDRLDSLEWSIFLKKQSIRFFVQRGMAALKEALGDDNATLVISPRASKIVIRGGEDARQILTRLIDESLEEAAGSIQRTMTGASCPICYDEISHPVTLGCNHTYCMGCLRHYLSTAADSFPLTCLGNEATCETPIPIPTIEQFLPASQFHQLLEISFLRHIERHPQEFKYCKTPDCNQVYRCSPIPTPITCPSCFLTVCSSCDEEAHEGISCADKRLQSDPGDQERRNDEWARARGVKRCPNCSVWIEKTEGCNHMTCKCGSHICWVCMGVFDGGQIYEHLNSDHGGFFTVPPEEPARRYLEADDEALARALARQEEVRRQQEQAFARRRLAIIEEARRQETALRQEMVYRQEVGRQRQQTLYQEQRRAAAATAARRERQESGWGCVVM